MPNRLKPFKGERSLKLQFASSAATISPFSSRNLPCPWYAGLAFRRIACNSATFGLEGPSKPGGTPVGGGGGVKSGGAGGTGSLPVAAGGVSSMGALAAELSSGVGGVSSVSFFPQPAAKRRASAQRQRFVRLRKVTSSPPRRYDNGRGYHGSESIPGRVQGLLSSGKR